MPPYLHTEALFHYPGIIAHSFAAVGVKLSVIGSKATLPGKARYDSLQKNCAYHAAHYGLGLSLHWSVRASDKIKYGNDMNNPAGKHVPAGLC